MTRALNREETASYTFQVLAQDKGKPASRQSSVSVVVTVLDVNDNGFVREFCLFYLKILNFRSSLA